MTMYTYKFITMRIIYTKYEQYMNTFKPRFIYIYMNYSLSKDEAKILKDDIIMIYGECKGDYTYVTVLGAASTVPKINAKYIDIISE